MIYASTNQLILPVISQRDGLYLISRWHRRFDAGSRWGIVHGGGPVHPMPLLTHRKVT
jgi:hypothetical protein